MGIDENTNTAPGAGFYSQSRQDGSLARGRAPCRSETVLTRILGEETVICCDKGQIHHLNGTASRVWSLCDGTRTTEEITTELQAVLKIPAQRLVGDVAQLLDALEACGLVTFEAMPRDN